MPRPFYGGRDVENDLLKWLLANIDRLAGPLRPMWNSQALMFPLSAIQARDIPQSVIDDWKEQTAKYNKLYMIPMWDRIFQHVCPQVITAINAHTGANLVFDPTAQFVQEFFESRNVYLIKEITEKQAYAVAQAYREYGIVQDLTPQQFAARIRATGIGPDSQQVIQLAAKEAQWREAGMAEDRLLGKLERARLRKIGIRSRRIAQNEMAKAWGEAGIRTTRDAQAMGVFGNDLIGRQWLTAGQRVCPDCEALEGVTVLLDMSYPGGFDSPWAHIGCRCTEMYVTLTRSEAYRIIDEGSI